MTHEIAAIFHLTVQQFSSSLESRGYSFGERGGEIDRENLFIAWQLKLSSQENKDDAISKWFTFKY